MKCPPSLGEHHVHALPQVQDADTGSLRDLGMPRKGRHSVDLVQRSVPGPCLIPSRLRTVRSGHNRGRDHDNDGKTGHTRTKHHGHVARESLSHLTTIDESNSKATIDVAFVSGAEAEAGWRPVAEDVVRLRQLVSDDGADEAIAARGGVRFVSNDKRASQSEGSGLSTLTPAHPHSSGLERIPLEIGLKQRMLDLLAQQEVLGFEVSEGEGTAVARESSSREALHAGVHAREGR